MNTKNFEMTLNYFCQSLHEESKNHFDEIEDINYHLKECMQDYYKDEPVDPVVPLSPMVEKLSNECVDNYLVMECSKAMFKKLELSRAKGRGGWHTRQCSDDNLLAMLHEHIKKGDMIDVMNLAGMIYMREHFKSTENEVVSETKESM